MNKFYTEEQVFELLEQLDYEIRLKAGGKAYSPLDDQSLENLGKGILNTFDPVSLELDVAQLKQYIVIAVLSNGTLHYRNIDSAKLQEFKEFCKNVEIMVAGGTIELLQLNKNDSHEKRTYHRLEPLQLQYFFINSAAQS